MLQYTGGTTGAPKGAMLTHANLVAGQRQLAERCPEFVPGEERLFGAVPMMHVSGLVLAVLLSASLAAELLVVPRFVADEAVALVDELRPTFFPIVPTMATMLLRLGGRPGGPLVVREGHHRRGRAARAGPPGPLRGAHRPPRPRRPTAARRRPRSRR